MKERYRTLKWKSQREKEKKVSDSRRKRRKRWSVGMCDKAEIKR